MMRGEIHGLEPWRFWRDEDKLKIGIDGALVTQRHGVTQQQIYAWRHDLKKKGIASPDTRPLFSVGHANVGWSSDCAAAGCC